MEVQGKYLQSVLEKAQEAFGKQNSGSAGLEASRTQLSELISKVSNECFTSTFPYLEKTYCSHNQEGHMAQINNFSMYSCLTSCQESQNGQEMHDTNMVLTAYYHGNLSLGTQEMEQIQSGWSEDLNGSKIFSQTGVKDSTQNTLPVSRGFGILSICKSEGNRNLEIHPRQNEEHNSYLDRADYERYVIQQRSLKNPSECEQPSATTQLDLNACDEYNVSKNGNGNDLNGFSWS
ncbi:myb-related protein 2-like [Phalaenopsis equestris]|uniref:myb-related protein 2-like n=1 Tax=Phalaenopsis equestris TaxID=78828 RepID=UPI0009E3840C|nr:myb-related protein 2-like [Phalaenopsis equestris]